MNLHKFNNEEVRSFEVDGEIWFVAKDVCSVLGYASHKTTIPKHCKKLGVSKRYLKTSVGRRSLTIINESNLYRLVWRSRMPIAESFQDWILEDVIPSIRKTGSYGGYKTPLYVKRANANNDRIKMGYFSVIDMVQQYIYGPMEIKGHIIADKSPGGVEIRPDTSVGRMFVKFLKDKHPKLQRKYLKYLHRLDDNIEVKARQYEYCVLPAFMEFLHFHWMKKHGLKYFESRDPKALEYLPKLLAS